jgi:tryptophan-rich sensory protein
MGLGIWMGVCFGAAFLGSAITTSVVPTWYAGLVKPSWTPPNWVFGPVWSALYLMMAVAVWLVWRWGGFAKAAIPLTLFLVQLALNAAWSILFFGLRLPGLAFAEIVILWFAILVTLIMFWRLSPIAGFLLVPYILWTTFAGALNLALWQLNAGGTGS